MSRSQSVLDMLKNQPICQKLTTEIGTSTYLSPEQETNSNYNEKVDIYALGLILCEMISKFGTLHERITVLNNLKCQRTLPQQILSKYPQESKIILAMTDKDPSKRPGAQDLLKSVVFEEWGKT
mmetsp:Transcript_33435/g.32487  ORF Transcript_33435/g.32487 Transcript_33435/m.32487 type:complete len:124 (+) Transcript_33435:2961-3332(+)